MATAPCDDNGTSYAWIDSTGEMILLRKGQTHEGFAWQIELDWRKANPKAKWKDVGGQDLMWKMLRDGWVHLSNSFVFSLHENRVTPRALTTLIELMIECVAKAGKDPEQEDLIWMWDLADKVVKMSVAKFIHKYGTKAQEEALFARLMKTANSNPARNVAINLLVDVPEYDFDEVLAEVRGSHDSLFDEVSRTFVPAKDVETELLRLRPGPIGPSDILVYHGTDSAAAKLLVRRGFIPETKPRPRGDYEFQPGRGLDAGLYVGVSPQAVEGYGRVTLEVSVPKRLLEVPQELAGETDPMRALRTHDGAIINARLPPDAFRVVEGARYLTAFAKTPCESESTSFAWIDPTGKVIQLPRRQSHVEWAWRKEHGSGWDEEFDWDEGMEASDNLLHDGWIRVPNSFTLEFDAPHVSPRAMAAAIEGLITCTVQSHKDPEKEIVWATPGEGVLKIPVSDFIHQYGTRTQENALFEQLMAVRVASTYLAFCPTSETSYAWIDPDGFLHKLNGMAHVQWAIKNHPLSPFTMMEEGWVRVSNPSLFEGHSLKHSKAWATAAQVAAECIKTGEEEVRVYLAHNKFRGFTSGDFVQEYGGRELVEKTFGRLNKTASGDGCDPATVSYAWIDPTGKKHLCTSDHMMFAIKYLTDQGLTVDGEPYRNRPYRALKKMIELGWVKVSNYMAVWGGALGKPAPAWEALAEMVAGYATPFSLDRNMEVWVGSEGSEKKEIEVADFIKRFGGRRLLDQVYERLNSNRGIGRPFPRDVSERVARSYLAAQPVLPARSMSWMMKWSWGQESEPFPREAPEWLLEDTEPFRPKHPVTLYRWSDHPEDESKKFLRSFTHDRGMVEFMQESKEQDGQTGEIIEELVHPEYVLIDTTTLPPRQAKEFINEVIVMRRQRHINRVA